jgi:hypothetical protein
MEYIPLMLSLFYQLKQEESNDKRHVVHTISYQADALFSI